MSAVTSPVLRYHGGKFRLASWVMSFFPEHTCYVEPFGGAAGVLLQKERVYAEVYNDLDRSVANFFNVLRDPVSRSALIEKLIFTEYSREQFNQAWEPTDDAIEEARRMAIRAQMGFGSAGATKGNTGFRIDTKREYGTAQHLWAQYPAAIAAAGQRLTGVLVENRPAISIMRQHDAPTTLHFVDPPYVLATRALQASGRGYYRHEMTDADHVHLLDCLLELEGFVVVSGYATDLYSERLSGWTQHQITARISANRGTGLRTEVVWLNPACAEALTDKTTPAAEELQKRMFA
ncbi:DNA adenine methylase [Glaciimonas sp. PCH181]|uniref:DNA adenine methylase n=1 Tax=Glaciimonas sp. PCH181 TaxID=2133943 RepID=UPI000D3810AA|nr:DNA adenine methylase [Glaciimonas sp. PCH181]PUA17290.1 DNA methyltransferase [Glaciimonas sp. PCH181]